MHSVKSAITSRKTVTKLTRQLSADAEMSVKNGAELLDRLMKDIVAEAAPTYISIYPGNINPNLPPPRANVDHQPLSSAASLPHRLMSLNLDSKDAYVSPSTSLDIKKVRPEPSPVRSENVMQEKQDEAAMLAQAQVQAQDDKRAFNLVRFIPLLSERVYVISPYTRMHLVSWIMVLDSIPDLELVAWLPEFLDGLL
jgi:vacuole morphology and inheritance protein 14